MCSIASVWSLTLPYRIYVRVARQNEAAIVAVFKLINVIRRGGAAHVELDPLLAE